MLNQNKTEKQQKKNTQTVRANQNFTNFEASKFAGSTGIENYNEKRKKAIIGVMLLGLALLIIRVMMFYPMQIYELAENEVKEWTVENWNNNDKHDTLAWKLIDDEGQAAVTHEEMIKLTQDAYSNRIAEIVDNIKTPGRPGYQAAYAKCLSLLKNYGENAEFGGLSWEITGENRTLSYAEADEILYLYSCQCDWDFMENTLDHYLLWLRGDESTDGARKYMVNFYGQDIPFPGRQGLYLSNNDFVKAQNAALEAAKEARKQELKNFVKENKMSFLSAMIPFIKTAFADGIGSEWGEAAMAEYKSTMDWYYNQYGKSLLDNVIYTNIDPDITALISYSIGPVLYEWNGTMEEYEADEEAQAKVKEYNSNPMSYRVVCEDLGEELQNGRPEIKYLRHWHLEYVWDGTYSFVWGFIPIPNYSYQYVEQTPYVKEIYTYIHSINIKCYKVIESVSSIGHAHVNASNVIDTAYRSIGG